MSIQMKAPKPPLHTANTYSQCAQPSRGSGGGKGNGTNFGSHTCCIAEVGHKNAVALVNSCSRRNNAAHHMDPANRYTHA